MPGRVRGRTPSDDLQRYPGVRGLGISHLKHRVAATLVVEPDQIAGPVALSVVEVGTHLADLAVSEHEPLRAAVEPRLTGLRVAPRHRPLDHGLLAILDRVV